MRHQREQTFVVLEQHPAADVQIRLASEFQTRRQQRFDPEPRNGNRLAVFNFLNHFDPVALEAGAHRKRPRIRKPSHRGIAEQPSLNEKDDRDERHQQIKGHSTPILSVPASPGRAFVS
ncbi:hypothetical protein [Paenibacillus cisolokensis]|uniref:hypothetical protein n=1 Tax=Paenibacillus cisolokensis TaxID=1658519 RepID=UPI001BD138CF|nr:hypothetical protein [Paenibacillus cisolokensis]